MSPDFRERDCDVVINVQGDEPLIDPAAIRAVVEPFRQESFLPMATLAHPIQDKNALDDPNIVKVVCDDKGHALYFSRAPIPFPRTAGGTPLQHVGLYAYRKEFLLIYSSLSACESEKAEQLEQLRVLHHGYPIAVTVGDFSCVTLIRPKTSPKAEAILRNGVQ